MDLTCSHVKDAVGEEERIQVDLFDLAGSVLDHCSKAGLFFGGGGVGFPVHTKVPLTLY